MADAFIFWFIAVVTVISGLLVVLLRNPIYSALSLVMTMVGVAGFFATLGATFIAGVQLIVYAGAVMVLFVMVLMLFDLRSEGGAFSRGQISGAIKLGLSGAFAGLLIGMFAISSSLIAEPDLSVDAALPQEASKSLGVALFTRHIFGFEALGILLLVIAVGTVALARSKGGTHANH